MLLQAISGINLSTSGNVVINAYEFVVSTTQPFGLSSSNVNLAASGSLALLSGTTTLIDSTDYMIINAHNGLTINVSGLPIVVNSNECIDLISLKCVEVTAGTSTIINSAKLLELVAHDNMNIDVTGTLHMHITGVAHLHSTGNFMIDSTGGQILIGTDNSTGDIHIGDNVSSPRYINIGTSGSTTHIHGSNVEVGTGTSGGLISLSDDTIIHGNLIVTGTQTVLSVSNVVSDGNTIVLNGTTTATDVSANGGGIVLSGTSGNSKHFTWDRFCPSTPGAFFDIGLGYIGATGSIGAWSSNQHMNLDNYLTYNINCKLALGQHHVAIDSNTSNAGIYFDGAETIETPTDQALRMRAITKGGRKGIAIEKYDSGLSAWNVIWRVLS
jgi:hypothetical protein